MTAARTSVPCVAVSICGRSGSTVRAALPAVLPVLRAALPAAPSALRAALPAALLALLIAGPSPISAQERLVGVVTGRQTSAPLVGVYVTLEREGQPGGLGRTTPVDAALTDEAGRFVLSAERGVTYRLVAERVGLATEVGERFTFESPTAPHRITMVEQPVSIEGLEVSGDVRTCRLEPVDATLVQRWWTEVSKALRTAAFVSATDLVGLRFEGFERDWTTDLRSLGDERRSSLYATPFRAPQDAEALSELGFVQGEQGDRLFLGPDAAVLFSEPFLADHCFGIAEGEDDELTPGDPRPGELRLTVEPTRTSPTDIRGVLTVDTLSGELRSFDFRYANLPSDIAWTRAGGHLTFEYLASGAWIVSDWWIRMPRIALRQGTWGWVPWVEGYMDRGGRVVDIAGRAAALDERVGTGTLHGTVYDSLAGGPMAGARVTIVGSRLSTRTAPDGRFTLGGVPAGRHGLTFHHSALTRLGLPSAVVPVDVVEGAADTVALATPGFAGATAWFCQDAGSPPAAILAGRVVAADGAEPTSLAEVRATWVTPPDASGAVRNGRSEGRSGSDGRYAFCGLPPDVPVTLAVRTDSAWMEAGTVELPRGSLVARELRAGEEVPAVVWGTVRTADDGEPLAGADVWILASEGDTVASARSDTAGVFRMSVPAGADYRAYAAGAAHVRQFTTTFTLASAQTLDLHFELAPSRSVTTMEIEGLFVEVEARNRAMARRLLGLYGQTPESLGRRWIDRAAIDSMITSGDPGVAIQQSGMPGVWVPEALKWGSDAMLCVRHLRTRAGCAIIVLNGTQIPLEAALAISFHDLEAIAVLDPLEATMFFGTGAGAGAVLMWTREGR